MRGKRIFLFSRTAAAGALLLLALSPLAPASEREKADRAAPPVHSKGGYYHDGRFATLRDVVDHYDGHFDLRLSEQKKRDLVEFLKSL